MHQGSKLSLSHTSDCSDTSARQSKSAGHLCKPWTSACTVPSVVSHHAQSIDVRTVKSLVETIAATNTCQKQDTALCLVKASARLPTKGAVRIYTLVLFNPDLPRIPFLRLSTPCEGAQPPL